MTDARILLRHTVATLAYRGGKAVRNAPESFADYRGGETSRTPGQILAGMSDNRVGGEDYDRAWPERARQSLW